jgi:hypothetical protein
MAAAKASEDYEIPGSGRCRVAAVGHAFPLGPPLGREETPNRPLRSREQNDDIRVRGVAGGELRSACSSEIIGLDEHVSGEIVRREAARR